MSYPPFYIISLPGLFVKPVSGQVSTFCQVEKNMWNLMNHERLFPFLFYFFLSWYFSMRWHLIRAKEEAKMHLQGYSSGWEGVRDMAKEQQKRRVKYASDASRGRKKVGGGGVRERQGKNRRMNIGKVWSGHREADKTSQRHAARQMDWPADIEPDYYCFVSRQKPFANSRA